MFTHGGRRAIGMDALEWAVRAQNLGAGEILLTSMDCDGTRDGYDIELTALFLMRCEFRSSRREGRGKSNISMTRWPTGGASAVLAASLFHFGELSIGDVKSYLRCVV